MPLIVTFASLGTHTVRFPVSAAVGSKVVLFGTGGTRPPSGTLGVTVVPGIPPGLAEGLSGATGVTGVTGFGALDGLVGTASDLVGAVGTVGATAGVGIDVPLAGAT